jgi:hypothetical protein
MHISPLAVRHSAFVMSLTALPLGFAGPLSAATSTRIAPEAATPQP